MEKPNYRRQFIWSIHWLAVFAPVYMITAFVSNYNALLSMAVAIVVTLIYIYFWFKWMDKHNKW